jgi:PadR family transcriptional regulator PadR
MSRQRKAISFMNGVPELLILRHLLRREMYGYELVSAIRNSTRDVILLEEGGVYPILHALQKKRLLSCRRVEKDGRSRLYYRLTEKGKARLDATISCWQQISEAINNVLGADDVTIANAS